jgi:hypothetical protein
MLITVDIRFSKDPTPYKTYFSAAWSRTGRKGPYAHYYIQIQPNGGSFVGKFTFSLHYPGHHPLHEASSGFALENFDWLNTCSCTTSMWGQVALSPHIVSLVAGDRARVFRNTTA